MHKLIAGRFFYGWVVVGVTALTLLVSAGVRSAPGVFLTSLLSLRIGRAPGVARIEALGV